MPNYCYNSLSIEATPDVLEQLHRFVASEKNVFDFNKIIPMPSNLFMGNIGTEEEKQYGGRNWYDWCNRRWGTKWNSVDAHCSDRDGILFYDFDTAWGPSEPVIEELVKLFPDTRIQYSFYEPGMCFCGKREYIDGKIVYSMDGDYTEFYYECFDEEDVAEYKQYEQGIFCEMTTTVDNGEATISNVSYRDTNNERTIIIKGVCMDARAAKSDFCWA